MKKEINIDDIKELFHIVEILKAEGFDIAKMTIKKNIDGKRRYIKLKNIEGMEDIIHKYGLNENYLIGKRVELLRKAYKDKKSSMSLEDKEKAMELGLIYENTIERTLDILEILKKEGIDISKITLNKGEGDILLKELEHQGIDIMPIIEKYKLNPEYPIGESIRKVRLGYRRKRYTMTDKARKKAETLGILSKKTSITELIEILEILKKEGIDVRKISFSKKVNGKSEPVKLSDIKYVGVDINEVIKKYSLNPNYLIGSKLHALWASYNSVGNCVISEEEKKKVDELGILKIEEKRRGRMDESIEILKILQKEGVDIRKIPLKNDDNKSIVCIEDIKQKGININEIIKKYKLDPKYPIGYKIRVIRLALSKEDVLLTEEENKSIEELGVNKSRKAVEEVLEILEILKKEGINIKNLPIVRRINGKDIPVTLGQLIDWGIDIEPIIEKYKLDGDYQIGTKITNLRQAYRGKRCKITEEEKRKAELLGVVKIMDMQKEQEDLEKKIEQAKELKKEAQSLNKNIVH